MHDHVSFLNICARCLFTNEGGEVYSAEDCVIVMVALYSDRRSFIVTCWKSVVWMQIQEMHQGVYQLFETETFIYKFSRFNTSYDYQRVYSDTL